MEYVANLTSCEVRPDEWARRREEEGWHGVAAGDHFWITQPFPHLWVTLATMAAATSRVILTSSFANNLFRSPVEFVQASLSLQRDSAGRFEAGLGAGWSRLEMEQTGQMFPRAGERARRYAEAMQICRQLFDQRCSSFVGEHYQVEVPAIGPVVAAPPLVASVGGDWVIRNVAPLADRVELKASASVTRTGVNDRDALAAVTENDVVALINKVRQVTDAPLGLYVFAGVGDSSEVRALRRTFEPGFFARFFGHATEVAAALDGLSVLGISRVQITEYVPDTHDSLAGLLTSNQGESTST